jgi:hypothetical protein
MTFFNKQMIVGQSIGSALFTLLFTTAPSNVSKFGWQGIAKGVAQIVYHYLTFFASSHYIFKLNFSLTLI